MKVASATASRVRRGRVTGGLLYRGNLRRIGKPLCRIVVKNNFKMNAPKGSSRTVATASLSKESTPLSREAMISRALDVADTDGLAAVSIRRIAQEFGVTPMALYWHVKNKDELLAAMGDAIIGEVPVPAVGP